MQFSFTACLAQKNNPRGLFRAQSFLYEDGSEKKTETELYKYCTDDITIQINSGNHGTFNLYNNDKRVFNFTGKRDDDVSIFDSYPTHFRFRWYNATLKNLSDFPYQQYIIENYSSEVAAREDIKTSITMLEDFRNKTLKGDRMHGVWRMYTSTDMNEGNFFTDTKASNKYRLYEDDKVLVMNVGNENFDQFYANCSCNSYKIVSDTTMTEGDRQCAIEWLSDDAFVLSFCGDGLYDYATHEIWYRSNLPESLVKIFKTKGKVKNSGIDSFKPQYHAFAEKILRNQLSDFDYGTRYMEANNAVFPFIMKKGYQHEYDSVKSECRSKLENHEWGLDRALETLGVWLSKNFDHHSVFFTRVNIDVNEEINEAMKRDGVENLNFHVKAMEGKVDSDTYVIRVPSCTGHNPTFQWVEDAVQHYKESGCKYLIVDDRHNEGGNSSIWNPIYNLVADHYSAKASRDIFLNTAENRKFFDEVKKYVYIDEDTENMLRDLKSKYEQSPDGFVDLSKTFDTETADEHDNHTFDPKMRSELPLKLAIIIDHETVSAGETLLVQVKAVSDRVTIYGRTHTEGSERTGDVRFVKLPFSKLYLMYPTKVTNALETMEDIRFPGIAPDVYIDLPYTTFTDNIDSWVLWVAKEMKK